MCAAATLRAKCAQNWWHYRRRCGVEQLQRRLVCIRCGARLRSAGEIELNQNNQVTRDSTGNGVDCRHFETKEATRGEIQMMIEQFQ